MDPEIEHFLFKVRKRESGCWEWIGPRSSGYGRYSDQGQPIAAHRWLFFKIHPHASRDKHIHHTCGNKPCVNPDHLEALTPSQHKKLHSGLPVVGDHMGRTILVDDEVARLLEENKQQSEPNWRVLRRLLQLDEPAAYTSLEEFEQELSLQQEEQDG